MSNIDDIWASMNNDGKELSEKPRKKKVLKAGLLPEKGLESRMAAILLGTEVPQGKPSEQKRSKQSKVVKSKVMDSESDVAVSQKPQKKSAQSISSSSLLSLLNRDIQSLADSENITRKKAILRIYSAIVEDYAIDDYDVVLHEICKPLFKRFSDPVEKCRETAHKLVEFLFSKCCDLVPVLGYYFPSILSRQPADIGYDEELKVFVLDKESHMAFKRGKAVDRQDKLATSETSPVQYIESSEEIRFSLTSALVCLIRRVHAIDCLPVLHPYFEDIMMMLQVAVHDSNPETKVLACEALQFMSQQPDFEVGFKYYSVALVRNFLPQLRHRQWKIRAAALSALHHVMVVPDRAKRKASGSEAIVDLIGFREENVLPIAAFYKADVQFNYLAELVTDKAVVVREKLVALLTALLTEIDDRYDHQQRLLPYLLDLLTDDIVSISQAAWQCLQLCGKQYEEEHFDEILAKKQYNVDGDERINLAKPLPAPFTQSGRPSIGVRLFVRGNVKRFLHALVNELTNWVAHTRLQSAQLMKIIVVLCEEHLTMETHTLLPALIKALRFARDDGDRVLQTTLLETYELLGRYLLPEVYLYYLLPRLRGDGDVSSSQGLDSEARLTHLQFLQCLLSGSKSTQILPHLDGLVDVLIDDRSIHFAESFRVCEAVVEVVDTLVHNSMAGKSQHVVEAFYLSSGRLSSLQLNIRKLFAFLLTACSLFSAEQQQPRQQLQERCIKIMKAISTLTVHSSSGTQISDDLERLFANNSAHVFRDIVNKKIYDVSFFLHEHQKFQHVLSASSKTSTGQRTEQLHESNVVVMTEHQFLLRLLTNPFFSLQQDSNMVSEMFTFINQTLSTDIQLLQGDAPAELALYAAMGQLLFAFIAPVYCDNDYPTESSSVAAFFREVAANGATDFHERYKSGNVLPSLQSILKAKGVSEVAIRQSCININRHAATMLDWFVLNHRWSTNSAVALQRLQLFALLCGHHHDQLPLSENESYGLQLSLDEEDSVIVVAIDSPFMANRSSLLLQRFPDILSAMWPCALHPSATKQLRLRTVHLFRLLLIDLKLQHGLTKLTRWDLHATATPDEVASVMNVKNIIHPLIALLVAALQDSDEEVREEVARALNVAVPLLLSNEQQTRLNTRHPECRSSTSATVWKPFYFEDLVSNLLKTVAVELQLVSSASAADGATTSLVDLLDVTLRSIAVLDPFLFEQAMRKEISSIDGNSFERMQEFLNDLVNHADLLQSISRVGQ